MAVRTVIREPVAEETTQLLTAIIKDELDQVIPGASLTTLKLTVYALDPTKTIINTRDHQNILGANGGSVDAQGKLSMLLAPADQKIVQSLAVGTIEEHILLFEWTYSTGKQGRQEILLKVVNMEKVPAA